MLRKAVFFIVLALGVLVIGSPDAQAACSATVYCQSSCSLSLDCPGGGQISCVNIPLQPQVSCSGNSCSSGQYSLNGVIYDYVQCDGNRVTCYPYVCSQGSNWIQCNNSGPITCSGGGNDD